MHRAKNYKLHSKTENLMAKILEKGTKAKVSVSVT